MGQGCSTSLKCVPFLGDATGNEKPESPDLVMNKIMKSSLATTEDLRLRVQHRKGSFANGEPSEPSPIEAGQERFLFQNLVELERQKQLESLKIGIESVSHHNNPKPPKGVRGSHRKIAESFEAERQAAADERYGIPTERAPPKHVFAPKEPPEEELLPTIGSECPTRLWIRRRPLSAKRLKVFRKKPKQQPPHWHDCREQEAVLLEPGIPFRWDENYFGNTNDRSKTTTEFRGNSGNRHGSSSSHETKDPFPNPYRSTHIYAIRYSDPSEHETDRDGTLASESPVDASGNPTRGGILSRRTESPPVPPPPPPMNTTSTNDNSAGTSTNFNDRSPSLGPSEDATEENVFSLEKMALPPKRDVVGWTTVSEEHNIYVVDVGLTLEGCDALVTTTEQACKGRYAAYTYAKQTLGCREYPELARAALDPVHSMVGAITERFGAYRKCHNSDRTSPDATKTEDLKDTKDQPTSTPSPKPPSPTPRYRLQLDDREPHIVKYDVTKKERQKLDMHTDKSEWTFLIALSNGCGLDYEGGGTYFECLDATVHIQKGHALVFPGKLRHKGVAIHHGLRFLLVGFLVHKKTATEKSPVGEDPGASGNKDSPVVVAGENEDTDAPSATDIPPVIPNTTGLVQVATA